MKKLFYIILVLVICTPLISLCTSVYAIDSDEQTRKQIVYAGEVSSNEEDGVEVSKIITSGGIENYFDITLNVKTTSKVDEVVDSSNLAVVFVIDRSFTMSYGSRWVSAVNAAVSLSQQLSQLGGVRMAAVGFSGGKKKANGTAEDLYDDTKDYRATFKSDAFTVSELGGTSGWDNDRTYRGGTNIESGLYRAKQLLDTLPNTVHKKIILLSDGVPTFYYLDNGHTDGPGNSDTRDKMRGVPECRDQAIAQATINKNANIDIYTIGYELSSLTHKFDAADGTPLVEYDIAVDTLTRISSDNQFYLASTSTIQTIFNSILEKIRIYKETVIDANWVANDPMKNVGGTDAIDFVGFRDDVNEIKESLTKGELNQSDTASFNREDNSIMWDIKDSSYTTEIKNGLTYYNYSVTYRIRLKNENTNPMFEENTDYFTNGTTILKYVTKVGDYVSEPKEINFSIPKVKGYLGNFEFIKKSSQNNKILPGAKFELVHDSNCLCMNERVHVNESNVRYEAISDGFGKVRFNNIPSGHKYLLRELIAPVDHILSSNVTNVEVNYGTVSGIPLNYEFINEIKKGNLEISKLLEGNTDNDDLFELKLEVWFNGTPLNGTYSYKLNNSIDGEIKINLENIKLGNNDKLVIYGLPVGCEYKITELTTNGYQVKHQVNSNEVGLSATAICNSETACRLEEGNTNTVKIINYAEYELPETGGSSMLIMVIIGTLLLVIPVIYIGYGFYQDTKFDLAS